MAYAPKLSGGADPYRSNKLEKFSSGETKMLINAQLLTEGVDIWRVGCIFIDRPMGSETMYTQIIGRGTRLPEGINNLLEAEAAGDFVAKRDCIILDVVGVSSKLSLMSLPSLFGMPKRMNLGGADVIEARQSFDNVKMRRPKVDLRDATEFNKLEFYATPVDLLAGFDLPEELKGITEGKWFKKPSGAYTLTLDTGEMNVTPMGTSWLMHGKLNGRGVSETKRSVPDGIESADHLVELYGGKRQARTEVLP